MKVSESDKNILLSLARKVISRRLNRGNGLKDSLPASTSSLDICCGVFVSLYVEEKLRGCIGTFSEEQTLFRNVKEMAMAAATSDSRFESITLSELEELVIEISVLTPRERIYSKEEIILGKHGIYIEQGTNRGTLLPQVALHQGWSVDEFLGNCAKHKTGIGWDGWKSADLFVYEAIVFKNTPPTGVNNS